MFDNVGQVVVEYGIFEYENSILNDSQANNIKHLCGFSIVDLNQNNVLSYNAMYWKV